MTNRGLKLLLENKRVVVSGGTGSLGQALVGRLLGGELGRPSKITVFSRDEAKQHDMRLRYLSRETATDEVIYDSASACLRFRIGDIRDKAAVVSVLRDADVVFHAAALKQVPNCEYFPFEAVLTNVVGSQNIIEAISQGGAAPELVVGISTDKACKPINVMGMTKALQERLLLQASQSCPNARFVCVRYGNVIASRGSVIPLFFDQIRRGGPVTITIKEMTRFLLSLDRAVDTIFAAAQHACPGETYVPIMPSARMIDLARVLIGERNIRIDFTGIRPGEKIHEILVSEEERFRTIKRGAYYVILSNLPEVRAGALPPPVLDGEFSSADSVVGLSELRHLLMDAGYEIPETQK